jgi:iron complex transport system substrate-binding protein
LVRDGGSAVDAAIATQMVLTLVEPGESGIGGGAFLLYYEADDGELHFYDGRETAPRTAVPERFLWGGGRSLPVDGLGAEWMALAGFRQRPLRGDRVSLEELLVRPPETILRSDYRQGQYSGEQNWLTHPLARRVRASQTVATDGRLWTCMGPLMIDEVVRLRRELAR